MHTHAYMNSSWRLTRMRWFWFKV